MRPDFGLLFVFVIGAMAGPAIIIVAMILRTNSAL